MDVVLAALLVLADVWVLVRFLYRNRDLVKLWWQMQQLSWMFLLMPRKVYPMAVLFSAIERKAAGYVDDDALLQQVWRDKRAGKADHESAAMSELKRRYGI